jgi:ribosome-associated toxin RatA of RatAB toxin-antitoxin module
MRYHSIVCLTFAAATISDEQHSIIEKLKEGPLKATENLWSVSMSPEEDQELKERYEKFSSDLNDFMEKNPKVYGKAEKFIHRVEGEMDEFKQKVGRAYEPL